jgi:putative transposase
MPQSLVKNYMHIVFSTKYRVPLISAPYEEELHHYLGGICKHKDCQPIQVGGYTDHVHILCKLSCKIALMDLVRDMKSNSSTWMKGQDKSLKNFRWQRGYGAFSVNPMQVDVVVAYIQNQHEHHKKKTFQQEYIGFLKRYQIPYDERYMWD